MYRVSKALRTNTSPISSRPVDAEAEVDERVGVLAEGVRVVVLERAVEHDVGAAVDRRRPDAREYCSAGAGGVVRRVRGACCPRRSRRSRRFPLPKRACV